MCIKVNRFICCAPIILCVYVYIQYGRSVCNIGTNICICTIKINMPIEFAYRDYMDQLNTRLWLMINYLVRMIASRGTVYQSEITSLCWPPKLENKVVHMLSIFWTVGKYTVSNLIKQPHPAKAGHNTTCTSLTDPELAVVFEGKKSASQVPPDKT